jgi:hypothetical protein
MEALSSSETSVLTGATRNIPEGAILHSHRRRNLKAHIILTGWTLYRRRKVSPVRYELGFYIPEDVILHSHRRGNPKSHNVTSCQRQNYVLANGDAVSFSDVRHPSGAHRHVPCHLSDERTESAVNNCRWPHQRNPREIWPHSSVTSECIPGRSASSLYMYPTGTAGTAQLYPQAQDCLPVACSKSEGYSGRISTACALACSCSV